MRDPEELRNIIACAERPFRVSALDGAGKVVQAVDWMAMREESIERFRLYVAARQELRRSSQVLA